MTVTVVSEIKEKYVDWIDTYRLNMDTSLGDMEKEIRLFKGTPLKIIRIYDDKGNDLDLTPIKGKTFKA